jgi:hypothetical protein
VHDLEEYVCHVFASPFLNEAIRVTLCIRTAFSQSIGAGEHQPPAAAPAAPSQHPRQAAEVHRQQPHAQAHAEPQHGLRGRQHAAGVDTAPGKSRPADEEVSTALQFSAV